MALVPETVARFAKSGVGVRVQRGAGDAAAFPDDLYDAAGATFADDARSLAATPTSSLRSAARATTCWRGLRPGSVVVGFLNPLGDPAIRQAARRRKRRRRSRWR